MSTYEVTVRFRVEAESVEEANRLIGVFATRDINTVWYIRGWQIEDTETHEIGPEPNEGMDQIAAILWGPDSADDWSADTLDEVAMVMTRFGYEPSDDARAAIIDYQTGDVR